MAGGDDGEYYAELSDGSTWWGGVASARFTELARDKNRTISRVAFGPDASWIIVFSNGKSEWRGIPEAMADSIRDRKYSPIEVSLGANETYYVGFADGDYDYSLPVICADSCTKLYRDGHSVTNVILSPGGFVSSWLIRHT